MTQIFQIIILFMKAMKFYFDFNPIFIKDIIQVLIDIQLKSLNTGSSTLKINPFFYVLKTEM